MTTSSYKPLIAITEHDMPVRLNLLYGTDNNITKKRIYTHSYCFLHEETQKRLKRAIDLIKPFGLKFKIWDAYRPIAAQHILYNYFSDPTYVSHPENGVCAHCRGVAIDLTLIDNDSKELHMGTEFDDFRPLAHHGNQEISLEAQKNRLLLAGIMHTAGFEYYPSEWWHYQLPNVKSYPLIDEKIIHTKIM